MTQPITHPSDQQQRRWYWTMQMELAVAFVEKVLRWPIAECGEPLVSLKDAVRDAGVRVTFSDKPHALGLPRLYYLRSGQIPGFLHAARAMNERGWVMHVEDGFRSRTMQKHVGRQPIVFDQVVAKCVWELSGAKPSPDLVFRRFKAVCAQYPKFGTHTSGSAIDISIFDSNTGKEVSRGGPYLEMSELTPMLSPYLSREQLTVRVEQSAIMRSGGLIEYPFEFWHFNGGDIYDSILTGSGVPAKYGPIDFDPATGKITPIENPEQPLNSPEELRSEIDAALSRLENTSQ